MKFKGLGLISFIFLAVFLCVSLPQAQSADATATVPATESAGGYPDSYNEWHVAAKLGALYLHRGDNKSSRLMEADAGPASDIYTEVGAGDLDLGWAPGMDASIMLHNRCYGYEVRYLGLAQWSESKTRSAYNPEDDSEWAVAHGKLKSALNNVELNLHYWPCTNERYNLLAGFRWLRLTDRLSGYESGNGGIFYEYEDGSLSSRNNLYGGQVGVEGLLFGKRDRGFSLDSSVKVGVFANKIRNKESWYYDEYTPGGSDSGSYSDSWNRTKTVLLSELGVNLNYAFTKNIAMTIGYELLYISKAAVPVNDYASTQHVLYQGSRVGLNFMF